MSTFFSCYFWWLLFGILLGFLAYWLYDKLFLRRPQSNAQNNSDDQNTTKLLEEKITQLKEENTVLLAELKAFHDAEESEKATKAMLDTAAKLGFVAVKNGRDNLTVVEGIGPKISELLYNSGIATFVALSQTEVSALQKILDDAGKSFQLAKPESWPKQALMCAEGRWQDLKTYQDKLVNGIEFD